MSSYESPSAPGLGLLLALSDDDGRAAARNVVAHASTELLVLQLDVGQGESALIIERAGETPIFTCIIDGGFATAGRGALIRYLTAFNIRVVDLMICSHFDGDHTKGLTDLFVHHAATSADAAAVGSPFVRRLLVRNTDPDVAKSSTKVRLLAAARAANTTIERAAVGAIDIRPARSTLHCIHADDRELQDENAGSLAFVLKFGAFSFYTAGDLPTSIEDGLAGAIGVIDAFKCGHHGSANSTSAALLGACRPIVATISCGSNSFGHPTFDVVERLSATGCSIQRFYLTNCVHNRRAVNPRYADYESEIFEDYFRILGGMASEAAPEEASDGGSPVDSSPDEVTPHESKRAGKEHLELKLAEDGSGGAAAAPRGQDPSDAFEGVDHLYDLDKIDAEIGRCRIAAAEAEDEATKKSYSQRIRIFRAMRRAGEHERHAGLKETRVGVAAGADTHLGTIAFHVPHDVTAETAATIHVGYVYEEDTGAFAWYRHSRGAARTRVDDIDDYRYETALEDVERRLLRVLDRKKIDMAAARDDFVKAYAVLREEGFAGLQRRIEEARAASEAAEGPDWDYDLMPAPDSPRAYDSHIDDRWRFYQRFDRPTIVGLHAHEEAEPYVPFCALCAQDFEGSSADFEFIDVIYDDEEVQFHRYCFDRLFVARALEVERYEEDEGDDGEAPPERVALTHGDVYDLDEIVLDDDEFDEKYVISGDWISYLRGRFRTAAGANPRQGGDTDQAYLRRIIAAMSLPQKAPDSGDEEW